MSHTISVTDLADQDAVLRVLAEIQDHGISYSLMKDGIEVAKVIPSEDIICNQNDKVSDEVVKKRRETMKRIDALAEKIAHMWNTEENAAELVANNRR